MTTVDAVEIDEEVEYPLAYWVPDSTFAHRTEVEMLLDDYQLWDLLEELVEPSSHDAKYRCSCPEAKIDSYIDTHVQTCDLWKHDAWASAACEWVPWLDAFVYIGEENLKVASHPSYGAKLEDEAPVNYYGSYHSMDYEAWGMGASVSHNNSVVYKKCRHYGQMIVFPDGTQIMASSHHTRTVNDPIPDYGVYFDSIWRPSNYLSLMLPWQDFGLPKVPAVAVEATVVDVLTRARAGFVVEIGCIGGHGRTGTFMALLAMRAGVDPDTASAWVHENYCDHAVEGTKQQWYVEWWAAHLLGRELPPEPPVETYTPKNKSGGSEVKSSCTDEDRAMSMKMQGAICGFCHKSRSAEKLGYYCNHKKCVGYARPYSMALADLAKGDTK